MVKTVRMLCLVQQDAFTADQILRIEAGIRYIYIKYFGPHRLEGYWMYAPPGQAFVAGAQSTASAVVLPVADGLALDIRHAFMREVTALWMERARCRNSEIVLNATDHTYTVNLIRAMSRRYRPTMRLFGLARMVFGFMRSRLRRGHALISVNMAH
ncbi:hypothetical protein [Niveispirillum sp. KHB5.9]|uniref:hypothetical protein n=1 Tax=Niveispirillum sp. KHB5.9 TaxID=3400269 RepID=UPI003A8ADE4C